MDKKNFDIWNLERHQTKDIRDSHTNGELTVIWRDWDNLIKNHPKMVYVSSVNTGEIKGPHIHTKRESYFTCIEGKVVFILKNSDKTYDEIISSEEKPVMVHVPKNTPSAHINLSKKVSSIYPLLINSSFLVLLVSNGINIFFTFCFSEDALTIVSM